MKKNLGLKSLQKLSENESSIKIVVFIGFILIAFIFLSDLFGNGENTVKKSVSETLNADLYISELETRLCELVSEIKGAGNVKIMLTLETLDENIYSERETAVKTTKPPIVRGVAVICDGGDNVEVKAKIVETVSKVLGISSARVCVTN